MKQTIAQLFKARDTAHAIHLKTRSFAQHLALGDFYTEIVERADKLAETYIGCYGHLDALDNLSAEPNVFTESDAVSFIRSVAFWAEEQRAKLPQNSFITNQWDEFQALIYRTKYKLEKLA